MSYFVGWAWVTLLRDLATLVAQAGGSRGSFRADGLHLRPENESGTYAGELLTAAIFGPVLTCLLLAGRRCGSAAGGEEGPPLHSQLQHAASPARRPSVRRTLLAALAHIGLGNAAAGRWGDHLDCQVPGHAAGRLPTTPVRSLGEEWHYWMTPGRRVH